MGFKKYFDIAKVINFITLMAVLFLMVLAIFGLAFLIVPAIDKAIKPPIAKPVNLTPLIPPTYPPNYPLNMDVTAYIGGELDEKFVAPELKDKLISVCSKVTYNETDKNFVYNYKISTVAKKTCFLSWEVLDRILNNGDLLTSNNTQLPKMVELSPDKTLEFSLTSSLAPALYEGNAWIYKRKEGHWELIVLKAQPGPLPRQD